MYFNCDAHNCDSGDCEDSGGGCAADVVVMSTSGGATTYCSLGTPGYDSGSGTCIDCHGCNCSGFEHWVGDGSCDNGFYDMYLNCVEHGCDGGDCDDGSGGCMADWVAGTTSFCNLGTPGYDSSSGTCFDCHGCACEGFEHWVGDSFCDDGAWGMYFNCDEHSCDSGDCDDGSGGCLPDASSSGSTSSGSGAPSSSSSSSNDAGDSPWWSSSLPCTYTAQEYDVESLAASVGVKMAEFVYNYHAYPQCVSLQLKVRTSNDTERDFLRERFHLMGDNSTDGAQPGEWVARVDVNVPDTAAKLGVPELAVTVPEEPPEPENATCSNQKCLLSLLTARDVVDFVDAYLGDAFNPCELLSDVYGCATDGCGCPYAECLAADTTCDGLQSCDKFPWDSCAFLEEFKGCDCAGCACTAGDDCASVGGSCWWWCWC
jgi:hypothetical protein